jgi:hypothetical protein
MAKVFYTEKDIEDMHERGASSLRVSDEVVLTEMAYEKARQLGIALTRDTPDNPPSAPMRPYISESPSPQKPTVPADNKLPQGVTSALHERIRGAVRSRLGDQVDPGLLDTIISRVLKSTGIR